MRLKIISDGHPHETAVIDVESGATIEGVQSIRWEIDKQSMGVAVIEIRGVEVDLVAKAVLQVPVKKPKDAQ